MDHHLHYSFIFLLIGPSVQNSSIFFIFLASRKKLLYYFKNWQISYPMKIRRPLIAYRCILFAKLNPLFSMLVIFLSIFYFVLSLKNLNFICYLININFSLLVNDCKFILSSSLYLYKFSIKLQVIIFTTKIMSDRALSSCTHKFAGKNCKKCGVYDYPSDPVQKTNQYESYLNCSSAKYLRHMRQRQCKILQDKQISDSTYILLQSICEKFEYTVETLALGIYLFAKTFNKQERDQKFWASAALIVASKGIQLDKRVPYLNRYQRYADKTFSQDDYQIAQRTIFEEMNFELQYTTFISFLNFYLTNGIIYKSDNFNPAILRYVQDDIMEKAKDYLKTGDFLNHHPQKLALSIIKQIRIKFRLQPWKKQLEILSGYSQTQVKLLQKINILKPLNTLNSILHPRKDKFSSMLGQTSVNSLQMSINTAQQKQKSTKKRVQNSIKFESTIQLHSIKQNNVTKIHDVPLASLRNQVLSISTNRYNNMLASANGGSSSSVSNSTSSLNISANTSSISYLGATHTDRDRLGFGHWRM